MEHDIAEYLLKYILLDLEFGLVDSLYWHTCAQYSVNITSSTLAANIVDKIVVHQIEPLDFKD